MVDPYGVIVNNGRYYLLAVTGKHETISHYRIDRILDIRKCKAHSRKVPDFDLKSYAVEHPYMYTGEVHEYRLRVQRTNLNPIFDNFGPNIRFENTDRKFTDVIVRSDVESMKYWLRRYKEIVISHNYPEV